MTISPFTPIFFRKDKSDGIESRYMQTFASTDAPLLEVFASPGESVSVWLVDLSTGTGERLAQRTWAMNDDLTLHYITLRGMSPGVYAVRVNGIESEPFQVTDNPDELDGTTLIQYSMRDNRRRLDGVFVIDGQRHFFDFRVPGGFKASEVAFSCDTEQYTTQLGDLSTLYSLESTQRKFTLGGQIGVPVWFGEHLNRILSCSYVYFDGERHERKDGAVPEMNVQIDGVDSFVFKINLQRVNYLNPVIENENLESLRRIGDSARLITEDNFRKT